MDKNACKELVILLQQMIDDKVKLIHGGQVIDWEDTKISEILDRIKGKSVSDNKKTKFDISDN